MSTIKYDSSYPLTSNNNMVLHQFQYNFVKKISQNSPSFTVCFPVYFRLCALLNTQKRK